MFRYVTIAHDDDDVTCVYSEMEDEVLLIREGISSPLVKNRKPSQLMKRHLQSPGGSSKKLNKQLAFLGNLLLSLF